MSSAAQSPALVMETRTPWSRTVHTHVCWLKDGNIHKCNSFSSFGEKPPKQTPIQGVFSIPSLFAAFLTMILKIYSCGGIFKPDTNDRRGGALYVMNLDLDLDTKIPQVFVGIVVRRASDDPNSGVLVNVFLHKKFKIPAGVTKYGRTLKNALNIIFKDPPNLQFSINNIDGNEPREPDFGYMEATKMSKLITIATKGVNLDFWSDFWDAVTMGRASGRLFAYEGYYERQESDDKGSTRERVEASWAPDVTPKGRIDMSLANVKEKGYWPLLGVGGAIALGTIGLGKLYLASMGDKVSVKKQDTNHLH